MVKSPNVAKLERPEVREAIQAWMRDVIGRKFNGSAQQWADEAKVAATTVTRFLGKPDAPFPSTRTILKLTDAAGEIPPATVRTFVWDSGIAPLHDHIDKMEAEEEAEPDEPSNVVLIGNREFPVRGNDIPVLTGARGGADQEMFIEDGPIDHIARPATLEGVSNGYAVLVVGESMTPMFFPGQTVHVNPKKLLRPGRGVVVWKRNRAILLKQFVRRDVRTIVLRELYPVLREFSVPLSQVIETHAIVGLYDS